MHSMPALLQRAHGDWPSHLTLRLRHVWHARLLARTALKTPSSCRVALGNVEPVPLEEETRSSRAVAVVSDSISSASGDETSPSSDCIILMVAYVGERESEGVGEGGEGRN